MTLPRRPQIESPHKFAVCVATHDIMDAIVLPEPRKRFAPTTWGTVKAGLGVFAAGYLAALILVMAMAYGNQSVKEAVEPIHKVALFVMLSGAVVMLIGFQRK
jgi:hypothetical protein